MKWRAVGGVRGMHRGLPSLMVFIDGKFIYYLSLPEGKFWSFLSLSEGKLLDHP
jgi:hypothetical protein